MTNQSTKKSPAIELALFNCTGETGMDNFGYLNSSFYFLFCNELAKKTYGVRTLTVEPLPLTPFLYEPVRI